MKAIIESRITILKLSSLELEKIIKDNRYQNPKMIQAEKMGRSCKNIAQYVYSYENVKNGIAVPIGYLEHLPKDCEITDNRTEYQAHIPELKEIILRSYQVRALKKASQQDQGIIVAPTGSGKTVTALSVIHYRQQKTLIITGSKALQQQWWDEIKRLTGIKAGLIGAGQWIEADDITIAMVQSLVKNPNKKLDYGLILVDECHHQPADSFYSVINRLSCKYRYGITATPERKDGLEILIHRCLGPIIDQVSSDEVEKAGGIVPVTIAKISTGRVYQADTWNDYLKQLIKDDERNKLIVFLTQKAASNMPVLLLTERVEHAEKISSMVNIEHTLIHGKSKNHSGLITNITDNNLTISTISYAGEGLDQSRWTTLMIVTPISSKGRLTQAIGRIMRPEQDKKGAYVCDFVDRCAFSGSSYKKRQAVYEEKNYKIIYRSYK